MFIFIRKIIHPVNLLLGCLVLSTLQVGILSLSYWFEWRALDSGSLVIAFTLAVPLALSVVLPLLVVLRIAPRLMVGVALYIFTTALAYVLRIAISQLIDVSFVTKAGGVSCLTASQDPVLASGLKCIGWNFLSQLALNAVWWCVPLAILAAMVLLYEHRQGCAVQP